jgi:hypothetical protein
LQVGELMVAKDWFNAGYIFPQGFKSRLLFRYVQPAGCMRLAAHHVCSGWGLWEGTTSLPWLAS